MAEAPIVQHHAEIELLLRIHPTPWRVGDRNTLDILDRFDRPVEGLGPHFPVLKRGIVAAVNLAAAVRP